MVATAPPAQRWLLIEHEGPWPTHALDAFGPTLRRALAARGEALDVRISLVRRPGRHPRAPGPLRWALADVRPGHESLRWALADGVRDVLAADWEPARPPSPGRPADEPVALVCTHSRHDVCCALHGRPVAAALESEWPGRVWECSHLGGDRFAASVVLLPQALCFGRLDAATAIDVLHAHESGRVLRRHLRGRCALSRAEQAAQAFAADRVPASDGIDALLPLGSSAVAPGLVDVVLAGDPPLRVRVRETRVSLGTPATCRATADAVVIGFDLVGGPEPLEAAEGRSR
jgi:hypothetical protein